jgi:hypothetical protein
MSMPIKFFQDNTYVRSNDRWFRSQSNMAALSARRISPGVKEFNGTKARKIRKAFSVFDHQQTVPVSSFWFESKQLVDCGTFRLLLVFNNLEKGRGSG